MLTIVTTASILLLLAWFTVFITGLSVGGIIFAEKGFDLLTFVWWVMFAGCVILFLVNPAIGQYVCVVFMLMWIAMQSLNFFARSPQRISGYNKLFERTHHIIPPSEKVVIPDTAHLILFSLLLIAFVLMSIKIFM